MAKGTLNYWLFQSNPKVFQLEAALAADALQTFALKAHKKTIKKGDKIILWQTGKNAGCYALAIALDDPKEMELSQKEKQHFVKAPPTELRIPIEIEYNLWNRPITKEILPQSTNFKAFYAGIPGTNFKATENQYKELVNVIEHLDIIHEPKPIYQIRKTNHHHLNTILQGPPGTGKTYQTVNYALSIIENRSLKELSLEPRQDLRTRFEQYQEEGRIQFITFHQSYAYEDFVEGIKPFVQEGQIIYGIENGIFKQICFDARQCLMEALANFLPKYQFEIEYNQLFSAFISYLKSDDFSAFTTPNQRKILLHKVLRFGNLAVRQGKSFSTFTISKNKIQQLYEHITDWDIESYDAALIRSVIGKVNTNAYWGVFMELKSFEATFLEKEMASLLENDATPPINIKNVTDEVLNNCRKYVLIIDEINRGNIPSIFGELISLLEADKREGRPEAINIILPYSKELFSIPPNLYLLGTMNTSDQSIDKMDIALRRRFSFKDMSPQPALLKPAIEAGVNLEKLLKTINHRIEALLDKAHLIGHAYFMEVQTLDDLIALFDTKIIPLLREYFFNDLNKIGLVLGKSFFHPIPSVSSDIFADFDHHFVEDFFHRERFQLKEKSEWKEKDFIQIYEPKYEASNY
jgi:5-methylcytosine-specific restriction protein B